MPALITTKDLGKEDLKTFLEIAHYMDNLVQNNLKSDLLSDFILATLFFEPSTRTRMSFESAMLRLGGKVISVNNKESSSLAKGETVYDSIKMIENYADIMVMRHNDPKSPYAAAQATLKPLINAGSGSDQHPTQALGDVFTIHKEYGQLKNLNVVIVGDLKFGRTVHSLVYLLSLLENISLTFISPKALELPDEIEKDLDLRGCSYIKSESWDAALPKADVIYMTRVQEERFENKKEYDKYKGSYILTKEIVEKKCKESVIVMHPLPRVDEIQNDVDELPNAAYFRQAGNGVAMRMAILTKMLGMEDRLVAE